ncbi:hypothetical protein Taro_050826 [Colocasia esculenta]|uniref:Uncharacterized protein n=1 Tax=Colocasia esculenta TaxID=4460 RepID=A0A843XEC9_COLES|nr:hypothetical protein [Colocasia esculenta]
MRRGSASRQPPYHDGKLGRGSDPYLDLQVRRDKVPPDWGYASTGVATHRVVATPVGRQTNGILNPGVTHEPHTCTHGGGEHGESSKAIYKTPRAPDPPGWERAPEIPTFHEERTHEGLFTSVGHLLLVPRTRHDAATSPPAPPRSDRRRGASPPPDKRGKGRRGERGGRALGTKNAMVRPVALRTLMQRVNRPRQERALQGRRDNATSRTDTTATLTGVR